MNRSFLKKGLPLLLAGLLSVSLMGCGVEHAANDIKDQLENLVDVNEEHVLSVKNGTRSDYPNITYGEAFESFFSSPTWNYFQGSTEDAEEVNDIVEFTGYCTYKKVEVKALIQFTLSDTTFEATYLSFNDVPQDMLTLAALLDTVFESYEELSDNTSSSTTNVATKIDYEKLYGETIDEYASLTAEYAAADNAVHAEYALIDLNPDSSGKNNRKELVIRYRMPAFDATDYYTYSPQGGLSKLGSLPYLLEHVIDPSDNKVYGIQSMQNKDRVYWINLQSEGVGSPTVWEGSPMENSYWGNDLVYFMDCNNHRLLENG